MIQVQSLRVDYDDVTAVRDIELRIGAGEIYGLIGPNGAGKTSHIKALAGVLEPTYGEVRLAGVDAMEHPQEAHRLLGYMPDFPPFYDDLKVWEYLDVFAIAHGLPRARRPERVDYCIEAARLHDKRDSFVRELSRGMKQRLALAKTLLHEPLILLLDEPASGLDPVGRVEMRKILVEAAGKDATVLISSHILTELSEYCTSVGIMEKGSLVVSGKIDEILRQIGSQGVLHVRAATAHPALSELLAKAEFLTQVEVTGNCEARALVRGDDRDLARLLGRLVAAGVEVASFYVEKEDIEDIFLKVGAKEVS